MGVVCSCQKRHDPLQVQSLSAVKVRPQSLLLTTVDQGISLEATRLELEAYFTANKAALCRPLLRVYEAAVTAPDKGLESVKLKQWKMKDEDWKHFSRLCNFHWLIKRLLIWKMSLSTRGFKSLCGCFERLTALKALILGDLGLGHHSIELFTGSLGKLLNLEHLVLTHNDLLAEHMTSLLPVLTSLPELKELSLDDNRIGDTGCVILSQSLRDMSKLQLLSVRNNCITPAGCTELLKIAGMRTELKVLLDGNEIGEEDLEALSRAVSV